MRSSIFLTALALGIAAMLAAPAAAEFGQVIGIGPQVVFPTGNFNNVADVGYGGYVNLQFGARENLDLMLNLGYITGQRNGLSSSDRNWSMMPMQIGAKYYVMPEARGYSSYRNGLYVGALTGASLVRTRAKSPTAINSFHNDFDFSIAPLVGYEINLNNKTALDLCGRYQYVKDNSYVGLRAGINFGLR